MKKIMLTIAGLLLISLMAVNAQVMQDTATTGDQPATDYQADENFQDMDPVQPSEVPASLRSTLESSQYTGWEEGKVYRHRTTNDYLVVIGDEDAEVYRFDSNGQRIDNEGQSQQGQEGQGLQDTEGQGQGQGADTTGTQGQGSQDMNSPSGSGSGTSGSGTGTDE